MLVQFLAASPFFQERIDTGLARRCADIRMGALIEIARVHDSRLCAPRLVVVRQIVHVLAQDQLASDVSTWMAWHFGKARPTSKRPRTLNHTEAMAPAEQK